MRGLKENNEDRNVIGDLRDCSGVLEDDDIVSEVSCKISYILL